MYQSREIRWFSKRQDRPIIQWFAGQRLTLETTSARTDYYLPQHRQDLGIKLREGNVEIKQRREEGQETNLTSSVAGQVEEWVRWSFDLAEEDLLSAAITGQQRDDWMEVRKQRMGVIIAPGGAILPISRQVPSGCQIEYARIWAAGKIWYTFGLEWFGEPRVTVDPRLISSMLEGVQLEADDSYGYPAFLSMLMAP